MTNDIQNERPISPDRISMRIESSKTGIHGVKLRVMPKEVAGSRRSAGPEDSIRLPNLRTHGVRASDFFQSRLR